MRFVIYCYTCRTSGKKYVGQTQLSADARWRRHLYDAFRSRGRVHCPGLMRALRKHGADAFERKVLDFAAGQYEANLLEKTWIIRMQSRVPRGYNYDGGGRGSEKHIETLRKIGDKSRARWATIPKERRGDAVRAWQAALTPEQKRAMKAKAWASMSVEQRKLRGERISKSHLKQREATSKRVAAYMANRTPEERAAASKALSKAAQTPEARARLSTQMRVWWASLTLEQRAAFSKRRGALVRKAWEARRARYGKGGCKKPC